MDTEADDFWEISAHLRWGQYLTQVESQAIRQGLKVLGRQPNVAMDIGSEAGRFTGLLVEESSGVTCTEICPKKVDECQKRHPTTKCMLVSPDDTALPVETNSIDFAIAIEVEVSETSWFIPELHRILTDSGVAVFTILNKHSYRGAISNFKSMWRSGEPYYNRSTNEVEQILIRNEFAVTDKIGFCWAPFGRFSNSKLIGPAIWAEERLGLQRFTRFSPWTAFVCQRGSRVIDDGSNSEPLDVSEQPTEELLV